MKINEVEALAGITKKNIRFYEEQGLICPKRNAENGYREYGEEDVQILRRIRLLRKLDVPIDEIRQIFSGTHTVSDGMRRHLITLEREQRNLQQAIGLCEELARQDIPIAQLDTEALLARIEQLEQNGTAFPDVQNRDIRYVGPVIAAAAMVTVMALLVGLMLWAFLTNPAESPPWGFVLLLMLLPTAVAAGTLLALRQRIREIQKGEIDDAKKY